MFGLEAIDLARMQFAFTVSFHILFPAITIGLASYLAVLEGMWLKTRDDTYRDLYHFWSKIFAVNFGMGVVSGLVMAYQFGTNWSRFSDFAGAVTGPLLTYEVLTAFFLEAGFLGVMLFGWNRVGRGLHFFSTIMVAIGTLISTFWILASNSWMQTPQGHAIIDGRVIPVDWFAVIFNPSFPYRLVHMSIAAFVATAFFVGASAAWHLLRGRNTPAIRRMFSMAMWMALIVAPVQAFVGDMHGLNTLEHQPAKIAAIEGHWENKGDEATPLILFGWPDMEAEKTRFAVEIPYLGSLILTHSLDKQVPALKSFAKEDRPNSTIIFWSFRVMAGLGMLMIFVGLWSVWLRKKDALFTCRPFLYLTLWMGPSGLIAILAGWFTTEIGRQPWVVYGLMRTADASSNHSIGQMTFTLVMFVVVYFALFGVGLGYMMRLVRKGPKAHEDKINTGGPGTQRTPARPLSAAHEGTEEGHTDTLSKGH
ncbi:MULTISPECIES: cytochrome ubiquinol oxidase subunit I [Pseudomonas]|uniref:Cytochrome ubiquinol oxidase subunit I n=1 Tax=Pseudomonas baltica TaxID=2762576 RepID=A0A7X1KUW5_9PSED|nr:MULTISPECIES: cytochrome ubiquinol oxidase subunit I [Pseudomonas]MBC2680264.1 cytochrome ubiquinol oxidase subunit I [Pseudomonas baltica]MBD8593920.1 cytochrome ubiquinol oxidase subunit I [Pseudomonas sp. CFBP 8758]MBD8603575.1 cytochrome ubiquinol oxidase subunit I [Pseudomonas sp. CFBP 8771]MBD8623569.1 cytochrome ubiquinol oxidase subunit I [Pseudomonas sp. CFBP 13727]MBD8683484.1 cytochrome ubiquinol oxidase subunit I [Pseudomonas sp. CFBP 13719]